MQNLPILTIPNAPSTWQDSDELSQLSWEEIPRLTSFLLAESGLPAEQQTVVRICADSQRLYARFECEDRDIWGSWGGEHASQADRNLKIYDEEVVELFVGVAPLIGIDEPVVLSRYFEFEISPNGVLLDVGVYNPNPNRIPAEIDFDWHCPGVKWMAERYDNNNQWIANIAIPWTSLTGQRPIPTQWRGNFYRIERPRDGTNPEFSCWSPTMADPANFHRPAYFGTLIRPET